MKLNLSHTINLNYIFIYIYLLNNMYNNDEKNFKIKIYTFGVYILMKII